MRHLEKKMANFEVIQSSKVSKENLLFPLLFDETKNCMHNKCMGLYENLAEPENLNTCWTCDYRD